MNNAKQLRGQLRQIVQEIMPELTSDAQFAAIKAHVDVKIKEIEEHVKKMMSEMNERHKDTMGYLVRSVTTPVKPE